MPQTHKIYDQCPTCNKDNYIEVAEFHPELLNYSLMFPGQFLGLTEAQMEAARWGIEATNFNCSACDADYNRYTDEYREKRALIQKILEI